MISPLRFFLRTACCTTYSTMNNSAIKQAVMLKKILQRSRKKRSSSSGLLSKGTIASAYENNNFSVRTSALNKIYMENVMPILTGGIHGSELSDLGVEVTKMELNKTLDFLNVYWITRKSDVPISTIEEVLLKTLKEVQLELGSLRAMAKVPYLRFVRDERLEKEIKLEKIFEIADYGEDYEPVYKRKVFTPSAPPNTGTPVKMRQNVLNLDHEKIKGKILASILRFKAINIEGVDEYDDNEKHERPEKLIPFNRHDFYKFYRMRKNMALKMRKRGYYDD